MDGEMRREGVGRRRTGGTHRGEESKEKNDQPQTPLQKNTPRTCRREPRARLVRFGALRARSTLVSVGAGTDARGDRADEV
jgi:hypothetical protein